MAINRSCSPSSSFRWSFYMAASLLRFFSSDKSWHASRIRLKKTPPIWLPLHLHRSSADSAYRHYRNALVSVYIYLVYFFMQRSTRDALWRCIYYFYFITFPCLPIRGYIGLSCRYLAYDNKIVCRCKLGPTTTFWWCWVPMAHGYVLFGRRRGFGERFGWMRMSTGYTYR